MSDDDSSPELHDIDPLQFDFFEYDDPFALSPQFSAVLQNDVTRLNSLLKKGFSVNINNNTGRTLLHVAVENNKKEVFDFMLTVEDIRLDVSNFDGVTPLMLAVMEARDYFALELVKKGADVNICRNSGESPLHYAHRNLVVALALIEKGADVNCQNAGRETPLYVACKENFVDFAHLLLLNGANPLIANADNFLPFTISLSTAPELQETLFNCTFYDDSRTSLQTIFEAMRVKSGYFPRLITHIISYSPTDFRYLNRVFFTADPDMFAVFVKKFEPIVCEFIAKFNIFFPLFSNCNRQAMDAFYTFCGTTIMDTIIEHSHKTFVLSLDYFVHKVPEDMLHEILLVLLSYGFCLHKLYVDIIYERFGFGELFKTLVHMDVKIPHPSFGAETLRFLMSSLICDISLDIDIMYKVSNFQEPLPDFDRLVKFFIHPVLSQCGERFFKRKFPKVPSLTELSRNCARRYLIEKYQIVNSGQFFTILKWLPIPQICREILSYQKPIYC